jgi:hypothetical protein
MPRVRCSTVRPTIAGTVIRRGSRAEDAILKKPAMGDPHFFAQRSRMRLHRKDIQETFRRAESALASKPVAPEACGHQAERVGREAPNEGATSG